MYILLREELEVLIRSFLPDKIEMAVFDEELLKLHHLSDQKYTRLGKEEKQIIYNLAKDLSTQEGKIECLADSVYSYFEAEILPDGNELKI